MRARLANKLNALDWRRFKIHPNKNSVKAFFRTLTFPSIDRPKKCYRASVIPAFTALSRLLIEKRSIGTWLFGAILSGMTLSGSISYATNLAVSSTEQVDKHKLVANHSEQLSAERYFSQKIEKLNLSLLKNQQSFKTSPQQLSIFADQAILPLWSPIKTLKGLFGRRIWTELEQPQQLELVQALNNTLQRYIQEGFVHYEGQQFRFISIKLNQAKNRGILTVEIAPHILPSFNVDFKVQKKSQEWVLYDVLVQGISYISLKKDHYRKTFNQSTIRGVLAYITERNRGFVPSQNTLSVSIEQLNTPELSVTGSH